MSAKNKGMPTGVRPRGDGFEWSVFVKDAGRRYGSAETLSDAVKAREQARVELKAQLGDGAPAAARSAEPESRPWTLKEAMDKTWMLPSPDGWRGMKSETTQHKVCNRVLAYFGPETTLQNITTTMIDDFIEDCTKRGNSGSTVNQRMSALMKVMKIAARRGGMPKGLPVFPKRQRPNKHRVRHLSRDEEAKVLKWFDRYGDQDARDATVVLIDTGLRPSELWWLEAQDVTRPTKKSPMVLLIYGRSGRGTKTDEFRSVPCSKRVTEIMERRCQGLAGGEFPLGFSTQWFHDQWQKVREQMGLMDDPQFVPYVCRHTCASRLVMEEVSLPRVQKWMGHKTIQQTMQYAHCILRISGRRRPRSTASTRSRETAAEMSCRSTEPGASSRIGPEMLPFATIPQWRHNQAQFTALSRRTWRNQVDAADLKSAVHQALTGSSPVVRTTLG